jgi:multiple sugar transport system permease protein
MERRKRVKDVIVNILVVLLIFYLVGPILWVVSASFQTENELLSRPINLIPRNPTLANYDYVFTGEIPQGFEVRGQLRSRISQEARRIGPALLNSFEVAMTVMTVNLILGPLTAYTFARLRFRGKGAAFNFILGSRLMPAIAVAIPYYVIIQTLGLLDTGLSLILIYTALTLPFSIWFLSLYLQGVPVDIEEAALIDGCSRLQALVRVVVPMAIPGIIAAGAFAFMSSYNEFLFARFLTQTIDSQTGPVIIASIAGNPDVSYVLISVCVTLSLIPPLILAVVLRRWLTEGLSSSITFR